MGNTRGVHANHFIIRLQLRYFIDFADVSNCYYNALFTLVSQILKTKRKSFQFDIEILECLVTFTCVKYYYDLLILVFSAIFKELSQRKLSFTGLRVLRRTLKKEKVDNVFSISFKNWFVKLL